MSVCVCVCLCLCVLGCTLKPFTNSAGLGQKTFRICHACVLHVKQSETGQVLITASATDPHMKYSQTAQFLDGEVLTLAHVNYAELAFAS